MNHNSDSYFAKHGRTLAMLAAATLVASSCAGGGPAPGSAASPPPAGGGSTTTAVAGTGSEIADAGAQPPATASGDGSASTSLGEGADRFIATVTAADGSPVRWPEIGGSTGDTLGQVTGAADPSGWYEVKAPGYATTYAKPVVTVGGYDLLDVELTPASTPILIIDEDQELDLADGAHVLVPSGALPPGTWLTVTELPARHLSAPWAPVDGGHRSRVFSFESTAADGSFVQPSSPLTLRIDDAEAFGGATTLATFDAAVGRWTTSAECATAGTAIDCAVPHFSMSTPAGAQPYPSDPPPASSEDDLANAQQDAQDRAEEAQGQRDAQAEQASEDYPNQLKQLLDDAAAAARSNPSRATKDRLASAIAVAEQFDLDTSAAVDALGAAYKSVAGKVIDAERNGNKPRCEFLAPLQGVVAEGEMISSVGADVSPMQDALDLLVEIEIECRNLWTGTIEYRFPAPARWEIYSAMTAGPGAVYVDRGIDDWVETAGVMMTVDPESGRLSGRVTDFPDFVPLRFRLDQNVDGQTCPGDYWEDFTVEGVGAGVPRISSGEVPDLLQRAASGTVQIPLEFDGTYVAPLFSVSQPHLVSDPGLRVQTQTDVSTYIVPCQAISDSTVEEDFVVEPYTTQLVDGFGIMSPVEPNVTLNEMLQSQPRTDPDGRVVIEGRRDLTVGLDIAVPFKEATVSWKFSTESSFEN